MTPRANIAFTLLLLLAAVAVRSVVADPPQAAPAAASQHGAALNEEQIRTLVQRAIAMQHRSDDALEEYDRTERIIDVDRDQKTTDTTSRAVPVGAALMRVPLEKDGRPAAPAEIAGAWASVAETLEARTHIDDPAVRKEYEKAARRRREFDRMVDAIGEAFRFHWAGRSTRDGRNVVQLDFEPDPEFKPSMRFGGIYKQIWGKVWVDESSGYVVRLEAELRRDVSFVAGIAGKIYRGSRVELEQAQAASGIWLPTRQTYDIEGRKFLFRASMHRKVYAGQYRRIGPPAEALALIRNQRAELLPPARR
jgi:hypothetical protein